MRTSPGVMVVALAVLSSSGARASRPATDVDAKVDEMVNGTILGS